MLVSLRIRRLARGYNVRVSSDKPKHNNFSQSRQKKRSKHTPIASVTPYSTSQPIHLFSYATSHNSSPESNKRPTNGHDYMTYSRRTASFMPIDTWYPATDESTHLQASSSYLCTECPPSIRPCQRHDIHLANPGSFCCFKTPFLRGRSTCEYQDKEAHSRGAGLR